MTDEQHEIVVGILRAVGRSRKLQTGDDGAAAFAMARDARLHAYPDTALRKAVEDLQAQGVLA